MGWLADDTTSDRLSDLPLTNCQTESVTTEYINEITAAVKKIDTGAAEAAIVDIDSDEVVIPEVEDIQDAATAPDADIQAEAIIPDVAIIPDDEVVIPEVEDIQDAATAPDADIIPDVATAPDADIQAAATAPIDPLHDVPDDLLEDFGIV
jgi:hypothetical protein